MGAFYWRTQQLSVVLTRTVMFKAHSASGFRPPSGSEQDLKPQSLLAGNPPLWLIPVSRLTKLSIHLAIIRSVSHDMSVILLLQLIYPGRLLRVDYCVYTNLAWITGFLVSPVFYHQAKVFFVCFVSPVSDFLHTVISQNIFNVCLHTHTHKRARWFLLHNIYSPLNELIPKQVNIILLPQIVPPTLSC